MANENNNKEFLSFILKNKDKYIKFGNILIQLIDYRFYETIPITLQSLLETFYDRIAWLSAR